MLMGKIMNLVHSINNKNGNYILESTIALPIFFIAVFIMNSIILMYSVIENANFILGNEIRAAMIYPISKKIGIFTPIIAGEKIKNSSKTVYSYITLNCVNYGTYKSADNIIALRLKIHLKTKNPLNINSEADYITGFMARAYVGMVREEDKATEEYMRTGGTPVYIFPYAGRKYHARSCTYLKSNTENVILNKKIKSKYGSCPLCKSRKASIGQTVVIFPNYGENYHIPNCNALKRNYIEIEKEEAEKRGYVQCSKC